MIHCQSIAELAIIVYFFRVGRDVDKERRRQEENQRDEQPMLLRPPTFSSSLSPAWRLRNVTGGHQRRNYKYQEAHGPNLDAPPVFYKVSLLLNPKG